MSQEPKPTANVDFSRDKYPITIRLIGGPTGVVVWERTVTLEEAEGLAQVEIPGFAGTEHYPVRAEIVDADGTTDVGGMS